MTFEHVIELYGSNPFSKDDEQQNCKYIVVLDIP